MITTAGATRPVSMRYPYQVAPSVWQRAGVAMQGLGSWGGGLLALAAFGAAVALLGGGNR